MMKKLLTVIVLALSVISFNAAFAHGGAKPKHGGVVQASNDLSFELVSTSDGASIYVEDHGKPMAPSGMGGKLTVLNGTEKSEADLVPAEDRLNAKGVKLQSGSKAVAVMSAAGKKPITVRFAIK